VIRIKDFQPDAILPLKNAEEKIKIILRENQAISLAKKKAESILAQLKQAKNPQELVAKQQLALVTKLKISRHEKNVNPEILKLAFSIPPPKKPVAASVQLSNGDYAVVLLTGITNLSASEASIETRNAISKSYADAYGKLEYDLYSENQLLNAKIKLLQSS